MGDEIVGMEQRPYNGHWAEVVLHADKDEICGIEIAEDLKQHVVEVDLWVKEGEQVSSLKERMMRLEH